MTKIADLIPNISMITFNVNSINKAIKIQRSKVRIGKEK